MVLEQIVQYATDVVNADNFVPGAIAATLTTLFVGGGYLAISRDRRIKKKSMSRLYGVLETYVKQGDAVAEDQKAAVLQKLADARKRKGLQDTSEFEFSDEGRLHVISRDNQYNPVGEQIAVAFERRRLFGGYKAYVAKGSDGAGPDAVVKRTGITGSMNLYGPSENDTAKYFSLLGSFSLGQRLLPKE